MLEVIKATVPVGRKQDQEAVSRSKGTGGHCLWWMAALLSAVGPFYEQVRSTGEGVVDFVGERKTSLLINIIGSFVLVHNDHIHKREFVSVLDTP